MSLEFELAIEGDLEAAQRRFTTRMLLAIKDAVYDSGREVLEIIRDDIRDAGLGRRLPTTMRMRMFPKGDILAYDPAAEIFSVANRIMESFVYGATINPVNARGLVIPIPGSPAEKVLPRKGQKLIAAVTAKWGPLILIPGKNGRASILAIRARKFKNGNVRRPLHNNKSQEMVGQELFLIPMLFLVQQVRMEPRLNYERIKREAERSMHNRVDRNLKKRLEAHDLDTAGAADV